jgi:transposase
VFKGQLPQTPQLGGVEAVREVESDGLQPILRFRVALLYVHVRRLVSLAAEEVEAESLDDEERGHALTSASTWRPCALDCTPVRVGALDSLRATTILRKYPTAEAFDDSCVSSLSKLRYDNGRRIAGPTLARSLLEAATNSVACQHGSAYRAEMVYLCDEIDAMRRRLEDLACDIAQRVGKHPVASLITTIEGIASLSAARIIAAVGDPARFRNGAALAAYVGAVPGTQTSGLRRPGHASLSPLGNARLRRALYMATLGAVQRNPWLRAFYQRLRTNGKLPKVALLAAMRKLLIAVHSIAKSRRPFVLKTHSQTTP